MAAIQPFQAKTLQFIRHITITIFIFETSFFNFASSKPTGFSFRIIPRDSVESPLYPGNLTQLEQIERLINFSHARAHYLKYSTTPLSKLELENLEMPMFRDNYFYIVQTILGNPLSVQFLLMDTGSGLTWTQCKPCERCYNQDQSITIYDSSRSKSYWKLPCSHYYCNGSPGAPYQCVNNECVYSYSYAGAGPTKGVASVETFRFLIGNAPFQDIDGIVFGCSNNNVNFKQFENTVISGIMGFSWAPDSLVTQLAEYTERRFSYCLVPFSQSHMAPSLITFGSEIPIPSGNLQTTSFFIPPNSNTYFFYLNLNDISVGWNRLGFPTDTFKVNSDGSGGFFIDSGSVVPALNGQNLPNGRNPYREVLEAFQKHYDSLNLKRMGPVPQGFQLCYEQPQDFQDFATLTYHFEGADYVVDGKYVNYYNTRGAYFCVALINGNGLSILGAFHQQNTRIIFNGNILAMQFAPENCV